VTPDFLQMMRGLAFEKIYLVGERLPFTAKELHVAVVLVSANNSLCGENLNCVRIEFGQEGYGWSTMKQADIDNIGGILDWWDHGCFGKNVVAVLDEWKELKYDPKHRNCIHFAAALLKGIRLESEELSKLQRKAMFWLSCLEKLPDLNAARAASSLENIMQLKRLQRDLTIYKGAYCKPSMA